MPAQILTVTKIYINIEDMQNIYTFHSSLAYYNDHITYVDSKELVDLITNISFNESTTKQIEQAIELLNNSSIQQVIFLVDSNL